MSPGTTSWRCSVCAVGRGLPVAYFASTNARCVECGAAPRPWDVTNALLSELRSQLRTRGTFDQDRMLTSREACDYLRLPSLNALHQAVGRHGIPHQKVGRSLRFRASELDAYMAENALRRRGRGR